jgi:type VI secretion system protein ImpG
LQCLSGTKFAELQLDSLRFFLNAEASVAYSLYELLSRSVCQVQVREAGDTKAQRSIVLPSSSIHAVGFEPDEGLLPYTARSFLGYRLLQEYFAYPEKFLFLDIGGLRCLAESSFGTKAQVLIFLDRVPCLEHPLDAKMFSLGCAPIINLFSHIAEPIRLDRTQTEYRVVPDVRRSNATEVYSVDEVTSVSPYLPEPVRFQPFYSIKHGTDASNQAFWYAARRPSPRKGDAGTEVYLSLVDSNFRPDVPPVETLTVHLTCTNRDLPGKLPFGKDTNGGRGDFQIEGSAPLFGIHCLKKPTETLRPPLHRGLHWRLLSHLALNYLSICEGGKEALQEILRLYDFWDSAAIQQQIAGIAEVRSRRVVGRPPSMGWNGFCRGIEITIEFDEEKYVGSGVFLFASVLERFLGLYSSLNSFSQLVALSRQREEPLKRWPPRAGDQILL